MSRRVKSGRKALREVRRFVLICLQMIETEEDRVKLEQLYLYYREQMYHVAYGILKNEHDAEDAVQQAFVSILGHLENISAVKCPETRSYVVITVERKALDMDPLQNERPEK